MTTDKEHQEEELLILKSILSEQIIDLGNENDQYEINIEFQLPTKFTLRLIDSSNELSTFIQHLPPLVLTVHYHEQYPSSIDSPTFVLSSCYLPNEYLRKMCQKLDDIWEENISQPIVYLWIECLKEYFLSSNELCLTSLNQNQNQNNESDDDPRAMSSYDPNQAAYVYQQLIEYNRVKENEIFLHDYHECPICLSNNIPGHDMVRLHKCHHFFCRNCLHDYAQMHINTGSVEWLLCPDSQCQLSLLPSEIKTVINNNELYEKYERLLLQKTLEQMEDIVWCPRCQQAVLAEQGTGNLALCDQCRFAFCKKCKKIYHSQTLCDPELELINKRLRLRQHMQALGINTNDEEKLLRDFLVVATIENTTRLCPNPNCKVPIEKNMGCDHMYCVRCRTRFNWSDAQDRTNDTRILMQAFENDFDKIREEFEREKINVEKGITTSQPSNLPTISELLLKHTKKCPNPDCRKINIKSGITNFLICEHCKRGFCAICGQSVNNPKRHFAKPCKSS